MDVGRALGHGLDEQVVHQLDDAGFLGLLDLVGRGLAAGDLIGVGRHRVEGVAADAVVHPDELAEFFFVGEDELDRAAREELELVERGDLGGVARRDGQPAVLLADGHALLLVDELRGQGGQGLLVDGHARKIDHGHVELLAQGLEHLLTRDEPEPDQHAVEPFARAPLLGDRVVELTVGDEAAFGEEITNAHAGSLRVRARRVAGFLGLGGRCVVHAG